MMRSCGGRTLATIFGVLAVLLLEGSLHPTAQTAPPPKTLLTASDFTFIGGFRLPVDGPYDTGYGRGLAHRYVNGELRFFRTAFNVGGDPDRWPVYEVTAPTPTLTWPYPVATLARQWGSVYRQTNGKRPYMPDSMGLYWDAPTQRLYYTRTHEYWTDPTPVATLGYATLNESTGVGTAAGEWGLQNLGFKQIAGGFLSIPSWFEKARTHQAAASALGLAGIFQSSR